MTRLHKCWRRSLRQPRLLPLPVVPLCAGLAILFLSACAQFLQREPVPAPEAPRPTIRALPEFVAVVVEPGDSLSSLALKYLGDPSKGWFIADFNGITSATPGLELVIPLKPYDKGGLTPDGFQTVPVLCYHQFSETEIDKMTVTRSAFEKQMRFLKDEGYNVIGLDQLLDFIDFKGQLPRKAVVITIDDGWRSTYDIAYPILKQYGYPATLFVYTDLIVGSAKTLNWDLIREMSLNGIDIQCHTKTHSDLNRKANQQSMRDYFESVERELTESAAVIRNKVGKQVTYLAYPYGETNSLVVAVAKKLGYRGAFTVERGGNPFFVDPYRVQRSMIYGDLSFQDFKKNLRTFASQSLR
ncbi:MAG TPA: polysaccharide deacetylase family protein [Syntrophobacteria bacterium]|nr:polysaccharide deacetylase family protein [Syntrophobacteria bacterium]